MRCGARLKPEEEPPPRVATFALAPLICYTFHLPGPGFSCLGRAGRWSHALSYQYFPVTAPNPPPGSYWSTEDDFHYLTASSKFSIGGRKKVTPFAGLGLDGFYQHVASNHYGQYGVYEHEFTVGATALAGINLIYTAKGSNVELGVSLGPYAWWEGGPGVGDKTYFAAASFNATNVTYYAAHAGVWGELVGRGQIFGRRQNGVVVGAGPAFAW